MQHGRIVSDKNLVLPETETVPHEHVTPLTLGLERSEMDSGGGGCHGGG
jgi:hypothetical protein